MPNKGLVNENSLNSIGTAINVLNGTEETYAPSEMGAEIINAIKTETASGNPIHITDAAAYPAESVVTTLEPEQDLHGYSSPWPAGGNVNLMPPGEAKTYTENGITFTSDGNGVYTVKGTATADAYCDFSCDEYTFPDGSNCSIGFMNTQSKSAHFIFYNGTALVDNWLTSPSNRVQYGYSTLSNNTINKYVIKVDSGVEINMTISPMVISGTISGSFPSTFSPYSNICPITGHTGVELTRTGKNLLPMTVAGIKAANTSGSWSGNVYTINKVTFTIQTDSDSNVTGIKVDGTASATTLVKLGEYAINVNYILSGCPQNGGPYTYRMDVKRSASDGVIGYDAGNSVTIGPQTTERCYVAICIQDNITITNLMFYPMIRLASDTDPTFEPYTPETHSFTFPQAQSPIYGCEVDWVNGVLRVDTAFKTIDDISDFDTIGKTYANCLYGSYTHLTKEYSNSALPPTSKFKANILRLDTGYRVWQRTTPYTFGTNVQGHLVCQFGNLTEQELQALLQKTPLQVVYELATPIETLLTPEVITLLKGENNIWTDVGTSEIEYKVDLQSYIQKLIDEASGVASALSMSPLSLGKSAAVSADVADEPIEESKEAEEMPGEEASVEVAETKKAAESLHLTDDETSKKDTLDNSIK